MHLDEYNASIWQRLIPTAPIWFCIAIAFPINCYTIWRLTKGLPNTFRIRLKALKDAIVYSVVYSMYFMVVGTAYFVTWRADDPFAEQDDPSLIIYGLLFSSLGAMDGIVWMLRQRGPISDDLETLLSSKHGHDEDHEYSDAIRHRRNDMEHHPLLSARARIIQQRRSKSSKSVGNSLGGSALTGDLSADSPSHYKRQKSRFIERQHTLQPANPDRIFTTPTTRLGAWDDTQNTREPAESLIHSSTPLTKRKRKRGCCKRMWARFGIRAASSSNTINMALRREVVAYTVCPGGTRKS